MGRPGRRRRLRQAGRGGAHGRCGWALERRWLGLRLGLGAAAPGLRALAGDGGSRRRVRRWRGQRQRAPSRSPSNADEDRRQESLSATRRAWRSGMDAGEGAEAGSGSGSSGQDGSRRRRCSCSRQGGRESYEGGEEGRRRRNERAAGRSPAGTATIGDDDAGRRHGGARRRRGSGSGAPLPIWSLGRRGGAVRAPMGSADPRWAWQGHDGWRRAGGCAGGAWRLLGGCRRRLGWRLGYRCSLSF